MLNFDQFEVLTFDCYGTLVDWESGILDALKPVLSRHSITLTDDEILELYAEMESLSEGEDYVTYRKILKDVMQKISARFGFAPALTALDALSVSIKEWKPFPDTVDALTKLKKKYKLAIISNIDDDLFTHTQRNLGVEFNWIITAEQARSYKPSLNNFYYAFQKIDVDQSKILHVAQSIHHDIIPAQKLGLKTVHIDRNKDKRRFGATPPASATADIEVPDLKSLVTMIDID
jgi:2-haloacid dehalogenase